MTPFKTIGATSENFIFFKVEILKLYNKFYKSCPTCILYAMHSQNYDSFVNFYFVKKKNHTFLFV